MNYKNNNTHFNNINSKVFNVSDLKKYDKLLIEDSMSSDSIFSLEKIVYKEFWVVNAKYNPVCSYCGAKLNKMEL